MANFNKVLLMGNLTRDIQLTYLPSNQMPIANFGIATNRTWTSADGQKKEEATFVDCSAFGKTAEILAKFVKKGDPLFVEGRLKLDTWEKDGQKHSKLKVTVENFQFLPRAGGQAPQAFDNSEEAAMGGGGPPQQPARQPYRPAAAPGRPVAQQPAARPPQNVEMDPPSHPEDDAPPIKDDDIPF